MKISDLFPQITAGKSLQHEQMQQVITQCISGTLTDDIIAKFLKLMHEKGETVEELTAAALIMQQEAHLLDLGTDIIDIVGTGGDGKNLFNVSTVSSFVVAAAGVPIAKHGNHASSGRSGSADLLLSAGFELDLSDENLRVCMQQCHIAFLFGPNFHQAMHHVRNARKQLGIRTLFNLIGPLVNPAGAKKQVVGVYPKQFQRPIAEVLVNLGSKHTMVVHSQDGLDEISVAAPTEVVEYRDGKYSQWVIEPKDYGCHHDNLSSLQVESSEQSLAIAKKVLSGQRGPARDIVLLNSAAALYCANASSTFSEAIEKAAYTLDNGLAEKRFNQLRNLTQTFKNSAA